MTWLPQTKRAIKDMNGLGFTYRRDFRAKTPHEDGGYQNTIITFSDEIAQRVYDLQDEIISLGYSIRMVTKDNKPYKAWAEQTWRSDIFIHELS